MRHITIHGYTAAGRDEVTCTLALEKLCVTCRGTGEEQTETDDLTCAHCLGRGRIPTNEGKEVLAFVRRWIGDEVG